MDFESETLVTAPLTQNPYADNKSRESLLVTHALRADGFDASEDGTGRGTPLVPVASAVRRLTPRECERLQGFPDDYTLISPKTADGPRYKALGNSMAVPVMRWIGERIAMADAL
jgi:DNA (cytosine-5)-methyltransferase 1